MCFLIEMTFSKINMETTDEWRETEDIKWEAVQCPKEHLKFGALYLSSSISLMSEVTLDNLLHFS